MASWEYKVVYMDFRGRASVEGDETFINREERRSTFARRVLNTLGAEGWELVGVQGLWPAETSYLLFKREGKGDTTPGGQPGGDEKAKAAPPSAETPPATGGSEPTAGDEAGKTVHL